MNEAVKYHNDLNKIKLPNFTELEQNLLFGLLVKIKNNSKCEFSANELRNFVSDKNPTNAELFNYANALGEKFFKADFTEIRKISENESAKTAYNLFKEYTIFFLNNDNEKTLTRIRIEINEIFAYLINELTANFTRFELVEFIALSGKYTKTLYRLLKQYRQTGLLRMEWGEFLRVMDIPESYKMCDIDQQILKPALRELTKSRTLFDQERIPFEKLTYTKLKGKGRGRGGNVIAIRFDFKPEKVQDELEAQEEARIAENIKNHIPTSADYEARKEFENYIGITLSFYDSNHRIITGTIKNFDCNANKLLFDNFSIAFENLQKANEWIAQKVQGVY
ncbi:MAG: replication initiation protein [Lachnospiraceae bacterium]|nr:replication initiation protein [Lachnospiraceae bacterium]